MIPTFDSVSPEAVVTVREYPCGTVFERHTHSRGQFAYASTGALKMFTDLGNWVVPPQRAIWVPGGVPHEMHMRGDVVMLNTYLDADAAKRARLQERCQVFEVSPLLRHLLEAALAIDSSALPSVRHHCVLTLLIDEIGAMPECHSARHCRASHGWRERVSASWMRPRRKSPSTRWLIGRT